VEQTQGNLHERGRSKQILGLKWAPAKYLKFIFGVLFDLDDGGSKFLLNVGKLPHHNVTSHQTALFNRPTGEHVFDVMQPSRLTPEIAITLLSSCLFFLKKKHDVSETTFCLRLQVEPTQMGQIERASPANYGNANVRNEGCTAQKI
jgi:hypothetical protein